MGSKKTIEGDILFSCPDSQSTRQFSASFQDGDCVETGGRTFCPGCFSEIDPSYLAPTKRVLVKWTCKRSGKNMAEYFDLQNWFEKD